MFHIAVCDVDQIFCAYAEQCIRDYGRRTGDRLEVEFFDCANRLCDYIQEGNPVDMVFLSVHMHGMSGLEAAKFIRETLELELLPIVFVSAQLRDPMELFPLRPQNFLMKPVESVQIFREIKLSMRLSGVQGNLFICVEKRQVRRIPMVDILYLESDAHQVHLTHTKGVVTFYGKLDSAMEQLTDSSRFVRVHQSFIISLRYVEQYTPSKLKMTDNRLIPVSQRCRSEIRKKLRMQEQGVAYPEKASDND